MKAKILCTSSVNRSHPILAEIALRGAIETGAGVTDHHLLVVGAGGASAAAVGDALDKQRGILVLDASPADKAALRAAGIGFSTDGNCAGYFVRKLSDTQMRVIEIPTDGFRIEDGPTGGGGQPNAGPPPHLGALASAPTHADTVRRFAGNVFDSLGTVANGNIPPGVKYLRVQYTVSTTATNNGQVSHLDVNYDVYGFLSNPTVGNHFQMLFLETTALANPGPQMSYSTYTKGWVQHELDYTAELVGTSPGLFGLFGHTPQNTARQQTVTTSAGFDIGYGTGSFNFSRSKTEVISDWEVIDQSKALQGRWTYAQMQPFSAIGQIDCCASSNGCPFGFWDTAVDYGTLSRYTLTTNTMVEWRTTAVTSAIVNISTNTWVRLGYYHSYGIGWNCYWRYFGVGKTMQIDFSKISEP